MTGKLYAEKRMKNSLISILMIIWEIVHYSLTAIKVYVNTVVEF